MKFPQTFSPFLGVLVAAVVPSALLVRALENGLAKTPPMGWRSWNCYHGDVSDPLIRKVIDAMVAPIKGGESLASLGFGRVGIDDGWQACGAGRTLNNKSSFHAADGTPVVNASKFPDLKAMVDYGHSKGVKMGWYDNNCICMDMYAVAQDPEWAESCYAGDIQQVLDAGFDGLKIDNCGDDQAKGFTSRMKHLGASGKAVLIENSNQGFGNPQRGACHGNMQCPGANSRGNPNNTLAPGWCPYNFFRTGGDIRPDFGGVFEHLQATIPYQDLQDPISRPGCWAYPDMLEVGNFNGPLNHTESRSHFGAWCIVSSPLILGLDVTNTALVESVWDIISNKEAVAVNQAWAGHPGRLVAEHGNWPEPAGPSAWQVWAKAMPKGGQAVFVVNRSPNPVTLTVELKDVGLPTKATARDIWEGTDLGKLTKSWTITNLAGHDSKFVRFSVDADQP